MRQRIHVRGTSTPELAWARYYYFAKWSEWSPLIQSVECDNDHLRSGQTGIVRGPCELGIKFTVITVDEQARTWDWKVVVPVLGSTLLLHHTVTVDKNGCATELVIEGAAPLVLGYLPLARLALTRLVRRA